MRYLGVIVLCFLLMTARAAATIQFTPGLTISSTFTDNASLTPEDEEYDYITTLNPGVDLSMYERNSALTISYNPTYASYTRFPENNILRHSAAVGAWGKITDNTRIELGNRYLYTEDPISDTDFTVRQGREPYQTNTASFGILNQFGKNDSIALRYEYYLIDNEDPSLENKEYYRPSLLLMYWMSPSRYALEWECKYTRNDLEISEDFDDVMNKLRLIKRFGRQFEGYIAYSHVDTVFMAGGDDYQVHSSLVGFDWKEQANSSLGASFGYFFRDTEAGDDDTGIVGSIESAYSWDEGSAIAVSGKVGYDIASYGAENLGFSPFYHMSGSVSQQLGKRLSGSIGTGYRRNIYMDQAPEREDTIWRSNAGLVYQALPWMAVRLEYVFRKLYSDDTANNYVENRGILSVSLKPEREVRLNP